MQDTKTFDKQKFIRHFIPMLKKQIATMFHTYLSELVKLGDSDPTTIKYQLYQIGEKIIMSKEIIVIDNSIRQKGILVNYSADIIAKLEDKCERMYYQTQSYDSVLRYLEYKKKLPFLCDENIDGIQSSHTCT